MEQCVALNIEHMHMRAFIVESAVHRRQTLTNENNNSRLSFFTFLSAD